jgi:hypothetical protein
MAEPPTLSIWIRDVAVGEDTYEVVFKIEPGNRTIVGEFNPRHVSDSLISKAIAAVEHGTYTADETKALGQVLFDALFTGRIRETYKSLSQPRIRLVIDLRAARRIPWEIMYDGRRFLSLAPFSRGITTEDRASPLETELPLRVLVVDSFPAGVAKLQDQLEVAGISKGLRDLEESGKAEVTQISGVTVSGLMNALREANRGAKPNPYQVLHFIGHGGHSKGRSVLLFESEAPVAEDERPPAVPVDAEGLLNVISGDADADGEPDIKLVFLNACRSVQTTAFAVTETFGPPLLRAGVPAVIGMQNTVLDKSAITFASRFYEAIADSEPVDAALASARAFVATTEPDRVADIGIPTLFMRSQTGRLFSLAPPTEVAEVVEVKPWWRRTGAWLVAAVAAAFIGLAVTAGWNAVGGLFRDDPTMNPGKFNVAIAEFDVAPGVDPEYAIGLSEVLFTTINDSLSELDFRDVWGPEMTGVIGGEDFDEREQSAGVRADDINADFVVYGRVEPSDFGVQVVPEFYINDRRGEFGRAGASELTGGYVLGDAETFDPTDLDSANFQFPAAMQGRAEAIAQFVLGLSTYEARPDPNYEGALEHFEAAEQIEEWHADEGREILYVFTGTAELALGGTYPDGSDAEVASLERAGSAYAESKRIEAEYARAYLGLGQVAYHRAGGGVCRDAVDSAAIADAESNFKRARSASIRPEHADVEIKADFGLARVYMCQQLVGIEPGGDPEALFTSVIEAHAAGNNRVADLAAESHGFLGLMAGDARKYLAAVDEYRAGANILAAKEGAHAADRAATMLRNAAFYQARTSPCEDAVGLYGEARDHAASEPLRQEIVDELAALSCPNNL